MLLWEFQDAHSLGRFVYALALLDSATALTPALARLHFMRGELLTKLYRFEEADEAFAEVLRHSPRHLGVEYRRGNNAFFVGQTRRALGHYFSEWALLGPSPDAGAASRVWAQIGRVYARLGVVDSARMAYERSLSRDTEQPEVWLWMAELAEDGGSLKEALSHAEEAIALDSANAGYRYLAGALQYRLSNPAKAIPHLKAAIQAEPWHAGAHYNLGRSLVALGRAGEGAPHLEATDSLQVLQADIVLATFAVRQSPEGAREWAVLAGLYERAGRMEEARSAYSMARQLLSSN